MNVSVWFSIIVVACLVVVTSCRKANTPTASRFTTPEVAKAVHVGMTRSEVIKTFGPPVKEFNESDGSARMIYIDEKGFLAHGAQPLHDVGFQIILEGDKVVEWLPIKGQTREGNQ